MYMYVHVHVHVHMNMHVDLNPASWAASVAQLAEHWTSNPVVTGSNPVRGSSVFFTVCLRTMPYLVLPSFAYTCTRFDHVCTHTCTQCTCTKTNHMRSVCTHSIQTEEMEQIALLQVQKPVGQRKMI